MPQTHERANVEATYSTPRWLKVFGIIVLVVILLAAVVVVTGIGGEHGPGRHIPASVSDDGTLPAEHTGGHVPPVQHGGQP